MAGDETRRKNMLRELSLKEFLARSAGGKRTAVYREFLEDRETPVSVLTRAADDEAVFLLESVAGGEARARYSILGLDPTGSLVQMDGKVTYTPAGGEPEVRGEADVLEAMRNILAEKPYAPAPELPPLQGGAAGYLSYDIVKTFEPRVGLRCEEGTPQAAFLLTDTFLVFDNVRQTVLAAVIADPAGAETAEAAYAAAMERVEAVHARLMSAESIAKCLAAGKAGGGTVSEFKPEMTEEEFTEIVKKCREAIYAGECVQIVPSQKFTAETDIPALALYRALRMVNPSPYNFFLKLGGKTLIGSSPEELVKLEGRTASTAPIAGTRPRGASEEMDKLLEKELLADEKERAEHVMLVDLGRNDLGRVCMPGTVKVDSYAAVERYSHVMHLVSRVKGTLEPQYDGYDLLRASFPAGTLTGAPKVRAMELIAEFEKSPRGIYGGAAGYFSLTGDMNFAIVIRTMVLEGKRLTMRAGAGIVADSDPVKEYWETINKSKAVFAAAKFAETL